MDEAETTNAAAEPPAVSTNPAAGTEAAHTMPDSSEPNTAEPASPPKSESVQYGDPRLTAAAVTDTPGATSRLASGQVNLPSASSGTNRGSSTADFAPEFGVPNLTRAQLARDGFSLWHWNAPLLSASEAQIADDLDAAAEHIKTGDVIFIAAEDGVLQRSMRVHDGVVELRRLA